MRTSHFFFSSFFSHCRRRKNSSRLNIRVLSLTKSILSPLEPKPTGAFRQSELPPGLLPFSFLPYHPLTPQSPPSFPRFSSVLLLLLPNCKKPGKGRAQKQSKVGRNNQAPISVQTRGRHLGPAVSERQIPSPGWHQRRLPGGRKVACLSLFARWPALARAGQIRFARARHLLAHRLAVRLHRSVGPGSPSVISKQFINSPQSNCCSDVGIKV